MSRKRRSPVSVKRPARASVFAALGDETRLALVMKLSSGPPCSISRLTAGAGMSRQGVTKHLRVLERAGIVHAASAGRERLFEFDPTPVQEIKQYLDLVSQQWDQALSRLKSFVES